MLRIHQSHPESHFVIIPNALARDHRLSRNARSILIEMLSYPEGWQTNADTMWKEGRRHRGKEAEGQRAIRSAFRELKALGYMTQTRGRTSEGRYETITDVYDVPHQGGDSATLENGTLETDTSYRSTDDEGTIKKKKETCPPLASLAGEPSEDAPPKNTFDASKRERDRKLFEETIGGDIKTNRSKWKTPDPNARVFAASAFYDAFRQKPDKPIKYPGAYVEFLEENGTLADWLIDEGLSIVERAR